MEKIVGFSRAVRVGPFIAVGGIAPVDANNKTVGIGDVDVQTTQCFEIIKTNLEDAGSGLHDIVRTRVIPTNIDDGKQPFRPAKPIAKTLVPSTPLWRWSVS